MLSGLCVTLIANAYESVREHWGALFVHAPSQQQLFSGRCVSIVCLCGEEMWRCGPCRALCPVDQPLPWLLRLLWLLSSCPWYACPCFVCVHPTAALCCLSWAVLPCPHCCKHLCIQGQDSHSVSRAMDFPLCALQSCLLLFTGLKRHVTTHLVWLAGTR